MSEDDFQRQLDDAIITRRQSVVSADVVGDLSKVRSRQRNVTASLARVGTDTGTEGIQMVWKVESFRAQLNQLAFPDRKSPRHGHVQLKGSRPLQVVITECPICTGI